MNVSQEGFNLIAEMECFHEKKYLDHDNRPVIGFGHIIKKDETKKFEEKITKEQAEELLMEDIKHSENCVNFYIKTEITQSQFDALVSFVFNVTQGAFRESRMVKLLNEKKYDSAANEFQRWCYKNGKKIPELVARRKKEETLFRKGIE